MREHLLLLGLVKKDATVHIIRVGKQEQRVFRAQTHIIRMLLLVGGIARSWLFFDHIRGKELALPQLHKLFKRPPLLHHCFIGLRDIFFFFISFDTTHLKRVVLKQIGPHLFSHNAFNKTLKRLTKCVKV